MLDETKKMKKVGNPHRLSPRAIDGVLRDIEEYVNSVFDVHVELVYFFSDNTVTIHRIRSRNSGQGKGTAAMDYIIQKIDYLDLAMDLIPAADFAYDDQKLIAWYQRFGFVYKDHEMYRKRISERENFWHNAHGAVILSS